jgi:hypothetical protein
MLLPSHCTVLDPTAIDQVVDLLNPIKVWRSNNDPFALLLECSPNIWSTQQLVPHEVGSQVDPQLGWWGKQGLYIRHFMSGTHHVEPGKESRRAYTAGSPRGRSPVLGPLILVVRRASGPSVTVN